MRSAFDLVAWATEVVERRAATRSSWCRHMQPVIARALAQANEHRPVDVEWVDDLASELASCRRDLYIEERRTT